ncbi:hypothetical protein L9F63_020864, partial [Diploptera punctata]
EKLKTVNFGDYFDNVFPMCADLFCTHFVAVCAEDTEIPTCANFGNDFCEPCLKFSHKIVDCRSGRRCSRPLCLHDDLPAPM